MALKCSRQWDQEFYQRQCRNEWLLGIWRDWSEAQRKHCCVL